MAYYTYVMSVNGVGSGKLVNQDTESYISADTWPLISVDIVKECDGLDGVVDGIVGRPYLCKPDLSQWTCENLRK